jgi:purine-binding chemotaxis protein CheW
VREIRGWTPATPMPQTPDYILGVINLRGAVMPVLDLRPSGSRPDRAFAPPRHRGHRARRPHGRLPGRRGAGDLPAVGQSASGPARHGLRTEASFVDAIIPLEGRMLSRLVIGALLPLEQTRAA